MSDAQSIVKLLTEEDDFSVKDAGPELTPDFRFSPVDYRHPGVLNVFVENKWIGRVGLMTYEYVDGRRTLIPTDKKNPYDPEMWTASWLPEMEQHPPQETFKTANEAAQWLWDHRRLQSVWNMESEIVNQIIDSDEGVVAPAPMKLAAMDLREAGFTVTKAEDGLIKCSWQAPTLKTFTLGAQRARQIVGQHLKDSAVTVQRKGALTEMLIRNRT